MEGEFRQSICLGDQCNRAPKYWPGKGHSQLRQAARRKQSAVITMCQDCSRFQHDSNKNTGQKQRCAHCTAGLDVQLDVGTDKNLGLVDTAPARFKSGHVYGPNKQLSSDRTVSAILPTTAELNDVQLHVMQSA